MRIIIMIIAISLFFNAMGQHKKSDLELMSQRNVKHDLSKVQFKGGLKVYNQVFTDQILNDCIYEHSCSKFSQHAFDQYGLLKGLLLTCDRLMRCNRATLAETSKFQITRKGKIKDHWDDYKKSR